MTNQSLKWALHLRQRSSSSNRSRGSYRYSNWHSSSPIYTVAGINGQDLSAGARLSGIHAVGWVINKLKSNNQNGKQKLTLILLLLLVIIVIGFLPKIVSEPWIVETSQTAASEASNTSVSPSTAAEKPSIVKMLNYFWLILSDWETT